MSNCALRKMGLHLSKFNTTQMPSLISGYEYDIFVSYRHKDNKYDGWVTEFVSNLRKELEATFKEDITIYFDENPHDGLLESHDVEDSLNSKLKCLILIPIISQTYCDPRSYAWTNEFLNFKKRTQEDSFGLKIKLQNGNTTSRILPVKINELDNEDRKLLEDEVGPLRSIDFIFKAPGVNRPLRSREEEAKANLNHTLYRDQINKVAYAVKEIITALKNKPLEKADVKKIRNLHTAPYTPKNVNGKKVALISGIVLFVGIACWLLYFSVLQPKTELNHRKKFVAVLPFVNMNKDSTQDYFSDGITEDILNHLVKISDLRVKSRTSTLQYSNTTKSIPEIASELDVGTIVEGSVRREGNKVRVVVQLIDVKNDIHLWSETYDREITDVLSLQSEVAMKIAGALHAKLSDDEKENIAIRNSSYTTAYDYYLRARQIYRKSFFERKDLDRALKLLQLAISSDPNFAGAYAGVAEVLHTQMRIYGISSMLRVDSAYALTEKAIRLDPKCITAYVVRSRILKDNYGKQELARLDLEHAYKLAPNNPDVLSSLGELYLATFPKDKGAQMIVKGNDIQGYNVNDPVYFLIWGLLYERADEMEKAESLYLFAQRLDPANPNVSDILGNFYRVTRKKFPEAIKLLLEYWKYFPDESPSNDQLAWAYLKSGDIGNAEKYWRACEEIEKKFDDTTQYIPFRHHVAYIKWLKGDKKSAMELFNEQLRLDTERQNKVRGSGGWVTQGYLYDLASVHSFLGNKETAIKNLDSIDISNYYFPYALAESDPLMDNIRGEKGYQDWALKKRIELDRRSKAMLEALNNHEASAQIKSIVDQ